MEAKFLIPILLSPCAQLSWQLSLQSCLKIVTVSSWRQKLSCNLHLLCAAQEVPLPLPDLEVVFGRQLQLHGGALNWTACTVTLAGHSALAPVKLHQLLSNHQQLGITSPLVQTSIFRVKPRWHYFGLHWELPKGKSRFEEQTGRQRLAVNSSLSKLGQNLQSSREQGSFHLPKGHRSWRSWVLLSFFFTCSGDNSNGKDSFPSSYFQQLVLEVNLLCSGVSPAKELSCPVFSTLRNFLTTSGRGLEKGEQHSSAHEAQEALICHQHSSGRSWYLLEPRIPRKRHSQIQNRELVQNKSQLTGWPWSQLIIYVFISTHASFLQNRGRVLHDFPVNLQPKSWCWDNSQYSEIKELW